MTITEVLAMTYRSAMMIRYRDITIDGQYQYDVKPLFTGNKRGWLIMDITTAHMLRTVRQSLTPQSQSKFDKIALHRLVDFGWKQVRK